MRESAEALYAYIPQLIVFPTVSYAAGRGICVQFLMTEKFYRNNTTLLISFHWKITENNPDLTNPYLGDILADPTSKQKTKLP